MQTLSQTSIGPRRKPKQHRSRSLVAAIREACTQLLESGQSEQLTAKRIAEMAGVAIGSFYQYFPNKEAVVLEVLRERMPREADRIAANTRHIHALSLESLPETIREMVHVTCDRHLHFLALHGEIYRQYHRQIDFHELLNESVRMYIDVTNWDDWVQNLLMRHKPDLDEPALKVATFLLAHTLVNMTDDALESAPELLDSPKFRADLTRMLHRYLDCEPCVDPEPKTQQAPLEGT